MNTPTHALVALALLARRESPVRNRMVMAGALIPDVAIYLWAPWQRWVVGHDWDAIWNVLYFEPPMQTATALTNSIPIYLALLVLGLALKYRKTGILIAVFAAAALSHIALDAPVHASDAYRHVWPLSDWRFESPISYWEPDRHARWVALVELGMVIACVAKLWRRFPALWVKGVLVAITALAAAFALAQ